MSASSQSELVGIGGWLILFLIIFALSLLFSVINLLIVVLFATEGALSLLTLALYVVSELLFIGLGLSSLMLLMLKHKWAPHVVIFSLIVSLVGPLIEYTSFPEATGWIVIQAFVFSLTWIAYFIKSERVKLTYGFANES